MSSPSIPTVSVVVPCYNDGAYIEEALDSARTQTAPPLEILVVDDGSSDDSREIAERMGATVLRNEGARGPGGGRNTGVLAARGELVALLDSDDIWEPDHLEVVGGLLRDHPEAGAAFSDVQLFGTHDNTWHMMIPPNEVRDCYIETLLKTVSLPSATVVRTAIFRDHLYDDTLPGSEDYEFLVRLCRSYPMVRSDRITVWYRKQGGRRSRKIEESVTVQATTLIRECRRAEELGDPGFRDRVHARAAEALDARLSEAWSIRDPVSMRVFLRYADELPGGADAAARWGRWPKWMPLVKLWDRVPGWVRNLLRRLRPSPID